MPSKKRLNKSDSKKSLVEQTDKTKLHNSVSTTESSDVIASVSEACTAETVGNDKPRRSITKLSSANKNCETPKVSIKKTSTPGTVGSRKPRRNIIKSNALKDTRASVTEASTSGTALNSEPRRNIKKSRVANKNSIIPRSSVREASTSKTVKNSKPRKSVKKLSAVEDKSNVPKINITRASPNRKRNLTGEEMKESEENDSNSHLSPLNTSRTPKRSRSFRMSIPKDFFSREDAEDKTPRRDGLDPEIVDYYLNEAYKDSPAYIDLKAKRFNTSFRSERRRHEEIEIFTPEEEAAFEEERRMLYGDQNRKEEEAVAAAYKFAEALTKIEQLCPKEGVNQDEAYKEFDRKLEEEIRESKKTKKNKSGKKGRGKKKDIPPDNSGPFCMWKNLDLSDIPKPFVEKEDDLLARWQAEVEASKKKSVPASSIEEPIAGPSYMSSFDPDLEDIAAKSTPKPDSKKSEKVSEKIKQKGKNKLGSNQVLKKEENGKKKPGCNQEPKKEVKGKKKLGSNQVTRNNVEQKR